MKTVVLLFALGVATVASMALTREAEPQCGQNEYFSSSDCNRCDKTCERREHTICPAICYPPMCMCKPGFYREPLGPCVSAMRCPVFRPPPFPTPTKVVPMHS